MDQGFFVERCRFNIPVILKTFQACRGDNLKVNESNYHRPLNS